MISKDRHFFIGVIQSLGGFEDGLGGPGSLFCQWATMGLVSRSHYTHVPFWSLNRTLQELLLKRLFERLLRKYLFKKKLRSSEGTGRSWWGENGRKGAPDHLASISSATEDSQAH